MNPIAYPPLIPAHKATGFSRRFNKSTISAILKRNDIVARTQKEAQPKKLSQSQLQEISERYNTGESLQVLANSFNIDRQRLADILTEYGVTIRSSYQERHKHRVNLERQENPALFDRIKDKEYVRNRRAFSPELVLRNRCYTAEWRKQNPELVRLYERNRRALEIGEK